MYLHAVSYLQSRSIEHPITILSCVRLLQLSTTVTEACSTSQHNLEALLPSACKTEIGMIAKPTVRKHPWHANCSACPVCSIRDAANVCLRPLYAVSFQ